MTKQEHRAAYEQHRKRAVELYLDMSIAEIRVADESFATAMRRSCLSSAAKFSEAIDEHHDELCAAQYHYTAAQLLEEMGQS